jgi:hypothetical protein
MSEPNPLARVTTFVMTAFDLFTADQEVRIRTFGVGLIALAALAAVGILLSRRNRVLPAAVDRRTGRVDDIYAAGL